MKTRISRLTGLVLVFSVLFSGGSGAISTGHAQEQVKSAPPKAALAQAFGDLPLTFIQNQGQMDSRVAYYLQGQDTSVYFASDGLTFALTAPVTHAAPAGSSAAILTGKHPVNPDTPPFKTSRWMLKLDFLGANPGVIPQGEQRAETLVSYFKGSPEEWHTDLPTYRRLVYPDLWPGIDLAYSGLSDRLKYEFIVKPGADPRQIRLVYRGLSGLWVDEAGQMQVSTPIRTLTDEAPVAYQVFGGKQAPVTAAYQLQDPVPSENGSASGDSSVPHYGIAYSFQVSEYDPTLPLVIDPALLVYCGYIGGGLDDIGTGIAVDESGATYVTGYTSSDQTTFPVSGGPDLTYNGSDVDAFVAKVRSDGTGLVYAGYIGGSGDDYSNSIAIDGRGAAYITGGTVSDQTTFPVSGGPDLTYNGNWDAFVAKVRPDGTGLVYAGYIGGIDNESSAGIAVDGNGAAYMTGCTSSNQITFPVNVGPDLTYNGGDCDVFVTKVRPDGTGLVYAGYIGGSGGDYSNGIAVDTSGSAYLSGSTTSDQITFPVTIGPDLTLNGVWDSFVAKVQPDGTGLAYAGYIGGSGDEIGSGIVVDESGAAYMTGYTSSDQTSFPVSGGPDLTYNGGAYDAFLAKISPDGKGLVYAGYIGGSGSDIPKGITVDTSGAAYVTGYTSSDQTTFPVREGPDLTFNGLLDAFVVKVQPEGTGLVYAGYIGGGGYDYGNGIAVDGNSAVYVVGDTASSQTTFPVVGGPDLTLNGNEDAFVAKIIIGSQLFLPVIIR